MANAATPHRILVVDDEDAVTEVMTYLLEDEGYEVDVATRAEDAFAKAADGGFSAVVLDFSMGDVGGAEIARRLRTGASTAHVPIVILSGMPERTVREQFTGYDVFVSKGADLGDLVAMLAALIASDEGTRARLRER